MYGQTLDITHSNTSASCCIPAGILAAAYNVRMADVKMRVFPDDPKVCVLPQFAQRSQTSFNPQSLLNPQHSYPRGYMCNSLRAALPGSADNGLSFSPDSHQCVQNARRAPLTLTKTGHGDLFAVLDQMGARHRRAFGADGLKAAFTALPEKHAKPALHTPNFHAA